MQLADLGKFLKEKGQEVELGDPDDTEAKDSNREEVEGAKKLSVNNKGFQAEAEDTVTRERRDEVKESMLHAWTSYEKYAWGFDELKVLLRLSV